jgi:hypothetical protein
MAGGCGPFRRNTDGTHEAFLSPVGSVGCHVNYRRIHRRCMDDVIEVTEASA